MQSLSRLIFVLLLLSALIALGAPAAAQETTTVRVVIERFQVLSSFIDPADPGDLFPVVQIGDQVFGGASFVVSNANDLDVGNQWAFEREVEIASGSAPISIQLWDSDMGDLPDIFDPGDDHVDVSPDGDRDINLTVNLEPCSITGDVGAQCWATTNSTGANDPRARLWFRVEVGERPDMAEVRVIVEQVVGRGEWDGPFDWDRADFYPIFTIGGREFNWRNEAWSNADTISPNWLQKDLVRLDLGSVPIAIEIWDNDEGLDFGDDTVDVAPPPADLRLDLTVALEPCSVSGEASGGCGVTIQTEGLETNNAILRFRIEVLVAASASIPGMTIRCLHEPIWPQHGQAVTITAEALDDNLVPVAPAGINMEIWVNDTDLPATALANANTHTFTFTPTEFDTQVNYGCAARDTLSLSPREVWSGWRAAQVGQPLGGPAVALVFNDLPSGVIDIVFVPEADSYTDALDPVFLDDIHDVLLRSFYGDHLFLRNQRMFNFWVAQTTTNLIDPCPFLMEPGDWDTHYAFADAGALLHHENIRDCSMPWIGLHTTQIERDDTGAVDLWNARTLLHEGAHKVYGLADEYFDSFTVYYQGDPFPNVYHAGLGNNTCELEAPSVGNTTCHSWVGLGLGGLEWETSDPVDDDLMSHNGPARGLDRRRICWVLDSLGADEACG